MDQPVVKILICVATYNERENLPRLVEGVFAAVPRADLLVIDDSSPDGTGRWCDAAAAAHPRLRCRHRPAKLGLGSALRVGIEASIEGSYDLLVNLDADLSHDPATIPDLLQPLIDSDARQRPHVDVVVGSRYVQGARILGWPWHRHLASWCVNFTSRHIFGIPVRDVSGAFRCYRVSALRQLNLACLSSTGYSFLEELLWHLHQQGASITEVPITFVERRAGKTKVDGREMMRSACRLLCLGLSHRCPWRRGRRAAGDSLTP